MASATGRLPRGTGHRSPARHVRRAVLRGERVAYGRAPTLTVPRDEGSETPRRTSVRGARRRGLAGSRGSTPPLRSCVTLPSSHLEPDIALVVAAEAGVARTTNARGLATASTTRTRRSPPPLDSPALHGAVGDARADDGRGDGRCVRRRRGPPRGRRVVTPQYQCTTLDAYGDHRRTRTAAARVGGATARRAG